uniref:Uncharacterized protein n=1 Tax=Oncorhynchus mykiss TaxID=8022 RepID=A0A8K9XR79_ONCMY
MNFNHTAFWSSDPSRLSSSEEEEEIPYIPCCVVMCCCLAMLLSLGLSLCSVVLSLLSSCLNCNKHTQCGGAETLTHTILKNDTSSVLFTGLPLSVFFDHVACLQKFYTANFKMHNANQILVKLQLNLLRGELAERVAVSQGGVSRIHSCWIDTMEEHMSIFIPWLPRETIQNTVLVLQREVPQYHLVFISLAYGARCSDKFITRNSGFLEYLSLHSERRPARVIRRLKVFKIIYQTCPINLMHKMDKVVRIWAALVDMQGEIIHKDAQ